MRCADVLHTMFIVFLAQKMLARVGAEATVISGLIPVGPFDDYNSEVVQP